MDTSTSVVHAPAARTRPPRDVVSLAILFIAIACFSVHVALLVATGTSMLTMVVAMLVLSGACVACTWRARTSQARRDHLVTAAAALTMIVVHLALMSGGSGGHDHGTMDHATMDHTAAGHADMPVASSAAGLGSPGAVDALMNIGVALAATQVLLAAAAGLRPTRRSIE